MASLTPTDEQPEVADAVAAAEASDEDNVCNHRFLVDCFMCVCMYVRAWRVVRMCLRGPSYDAPGGEICRSWGRKARGGGRRGGSS